MRAQDDEPILAASIDRFCLFPLKHPATFEWYLKQVASFWTVSEVDLAQDLLDYASLTADERAFISRILAFFAASDAIVNENLAARFAEEVQVPEIRQFYGFQIGMETIHAHMYGLMIEAYETDVAQRARLFAAIRTDAAVRLKADWALRWLASDAPFAERLVAFACVEGIFFSASFCAIFFFKKRGKMPGLTFSNELISRDEGLHRDFACHVYTDFVRGKLTEQRAREIVRSAVDCECAFVEKALELDIIGMNAQLMCQYVQYVADHLLVALGHERAYGVANPFDWLELISLQGKTNFFEKRVGEYQKAGVLDGACARSFAVDADF